MNKTVIDEIKGKEQLIRELKVARALIAVEVKEKIKEKEKNEYKQKKIIKLKNEIEKIIYDLDSQIVDSMSKKEIIDFLRQKSTQLKKVINKTEIPDCDWDCVVDINKNIKSKDEMQRINNMREKVFSIAS